MLLKRLQCRLSSGIGGVVREPPGNDLDVVALHRLDLVPERRDILSTPIVGETLDSQPIEHLCALFRVAMFRIKRYYAPSEEIIFRPDSRRRSDRFAWTLSVKQGSEQSKHESN